eukprot:CAMPEP_0119565234 /NCGR_PEP_ID=MMETSP1352-20130426/29368_1 /TAXON_ID=265584 /ORGANISM="Stauroneis constricta, Strain CCMP1120" /LENGTH=103 /DNA_ID=CAMNT_0007614107 /DNA_START=25 /DNA_END=332 /DNA_ORIENTATION=-
MPTRLREILRDSYSIDFVEVDCVPTTSKQEETNIRVEQSYIKIPSMENYMTYLIGTLLSCKNEAKQGCAKLIVFFPTNKLARFYAHLLQVAEFDLPLFQLHSA